MSKAKNALSESELSDLFKTVQKNNTEVEEAATKPVAKSAPVVEKSLDKTKKDEYNQNKAFSIRKNSETKKWDILEIDYNIKDGTARIVDTLMSMDNQAMARMRMEEAMTRVLNKLPLDGMRTRKK